jgi:hypothetical protein
MWVERSCETFLLFASLVETAARVRHENPPSSKNEVKTFA